MGGFAVVFLVVTAGLGLLSLVLLSYARKEEKKEAERQARINEQKRRKEIEYKKQHPHHEAEQFYKACKKAGIKDANSSEEKARIMLQAKNKSLKMTQKEAIDFFLLGKSEVEKFAEEDRKKREVALVKSLKTKERRYESETTRYKDLSGQDKMRTMCLDNVKVYKNQLDMLKRNAEEVLDSAVSTYNTLKQREGDWATAGGIASGIAGGAAGVAVAMDVQMRNAEIRLQNSQLQSSINSLAGLSYQQNIQKQVEVTEELEFWQKLADQSKELLVEELPDVDLIEKIAPVVTEQKQSKTGAVKLKVQIKPAANLKIYDTVNAIVDGSIKAVLWDGETKVGHAYLVLPYNGATYTTTLEGICCSDTLKPNKKYKVTFEAHHLWGIEKIKNK